MKKSTEKISDRLYKDTISRIQDIATDHEQKADVYEALVQAYDLVNIQQHKHLKNVSKNFWILLNDLSKSFLDLVNQSNSLLQVEKEKVKRSEELYKEKVFEQTELTQDYDKQLVAKDEEIEKLNAKIITFETLEQQLKDKDMIIDTLKKENEAFEAKLDEHNLVMEENTALLRKLQSHKDDLNKEKAANRLLTETIKHKEELINNLHDKVTISEGIKRLLKNKQGEEIEKATGS
ncbi:hypothetical protein V1503_24210 [Bacillus sp. SCS-151]|uniref:hypothetical protein n=1 Tax=Nanhaiella sioensis TaxID=3115293 RepID=UPI0039790A04